MRKEGKMQEERIEWERARWMKFIDLQLNPNIKKVHKPSCPQKWIPFAWEQQDKKKIKPPKQLHTTERETEILRGIFDRLK